MPTIAPTLIVTFAAVGVNIDGGGDGTDPEGACSNGDDGGDGTDSEGEGADDGGCVCNNSDGGGDNKSSGGGGDAYISNIAKRQDAFVHNVVGV